MGLSKTILASIIGGMGAVVTPFVLMNSRIAGVGDSRTDQLSYGAFNASIGAGAVSFWTSKIDQSSNSHLAWLEVLSASRYRTWLESALGGTTSLYHAQKMAPQAIASGCGTIIYVGNVNDPAYSISKNSSIANVDSIVQQSKAAGVCCVLLTDPGASNTPNHNVFHGSGGINEHILSLHNPLQGVIAIDIRDIFLDKTGDSYLPWTMKTGVYYDTPQIHWAIPAAKQVGQRIKDTLDALGWWAAAPGRPDSARNIIANADFATATGGTLGTNNTGVLPSGAAGQSSATGNSIAWSVNTRGDGHKEIVGVLTRAAGTTSIVRHELSWTVGLAAAGVAPGDYIQGGVVVDLDDGHSNVIGTHVMTDISYTGGPSFEQGYKMLASSSNATYKYPAGAIPDLDLRTTAHKMNPLATGFGTCRIRAGIQTNGDCTVTFRVRLPYCIKLAAEERQAEFETFATNTAYPSVSGTATVGSTLTAVNTTWTANTVPTFTYQWYRTPDTTLNQQTIAGETGTTYVVRPEDVGYKIYFRVTATTGAGDNIVPSTMSGFVS